MYARPRPRLGLSSTRAPWARARLERAVGGTADDKNLTANSGVLQALDHPLDKQTDREFFVAGRNDDGQLRIGLVDNGQMQLQIRVVRDRNNPGWIRNWQAQVPLFLSA